MHLDALVATPVRLRLRGGIDDLTETLALRAALTAAHLLGLATGILLRRLRELDDPLAEALARAKEAEFKAACFLTAAQTIGARFDKLPERKRPFYTPRQRFQILELKNLLGFSADQVARLFRVCTHTILNWERNIDADQRTVGKTVRPTPPITRFADVVRHTVQMMGRFRQRRDGGPRPHTRGLESLRAHRPPGSQREAEAGACSASEPGTAHDHPPRHRPLREPHLDDGRHRDPGLPRRRHVLPRHRLRRLLQGPARGPGLPRKARRLGHGQAHEGRPQSLRQGQVPHHRPGGEFKGKVFQKTAVRLGIQHRFGTKDRLFATARLERFWRTLKQLTNVKADQSLNLDDLEARVELALVYYLCFRPHQGLAGATPAEAFLGIEPACAKAARPPRGRIGEGPREPPFAVGFLDPEKRAFPILKAA
jgi:hypothetical protein